MAHRILIIGASGSGTTTTGRVLADVLNIPHLDLDSLFWAQTTIPFTVRRPRSELRQLAEEQLYHSKNWVISGDPSSWNIGIEGYLTAVVFLIVPTDIRVQRIKDREKKRFGAKILEGGMLYEQHQQFLDWTRKYDEGGIEGRTREKQETWLSTLKTPIFRFVGNALPKDIVGKVVDCLERSTE